MSSFSFIHWAMLALIVYILLIAVKGLIGAGGKEMHCLDCGTQGKSEIHTPGHRFIEIILWICFIIPGLIYSIWRITARKHACRACGSQRLIPPNTPAAIAHKQQLSYTK